MLIYISSTFDYMVGIMSSTFLRILPSFIREFSVLFQQTFKLLMDQHSSSKICLETFNELV